ncbi:CD109 antigen-like [Physella acuta]|uniref:CD109 antigen-like n=1 Tax=Physella acuta TaxID=109671 RepID=UPI0027DC4E0C|nr:CD109 antigen-like [Physella acuta]
MGNPASGETYLAITSDSSYLILAPSTIRPNMDFTVSVNILKATSYVAVVAQVLKEKTLVANGVNVFKAGTPGTITMKLPADLTDSDYTLKVVGGGGVNFENYKIISYNSKEASLFIQLNKAIFKPSDTVKYRVFGVYSDLQSYKGTMDISIYDAKNNKIKQWVKVTPVKGVIAEELTLSSQPVLGDWKVVVEAGNLKEEKSFNVAEYVLPKFEVEVIMPPYVLTSDFDVTFTIKTKYTYGKPVKGNAIVQVNLHDYWKTKPVYQLIIPIDGETRAVVPMSKVKEFAYSLNEVTLIVSANVIESLTGNQMSSNGTVTMYDKGVKLEYPENNPKTFKPGLQYIAYLKISQPDGLPIRSTSETVTVNFRFYNYSRGFFSSPIADIPDQTLSVPSSGLVPILVQTPTFHEAVIISSDFQGVTRTLYLEKRHSPSSSYIQIYLQSASIQAGDIILFSINGTEELSILLYQVLSRGNIIKSGTINGNNQKSVNFSVVSEPSMAPSARIVVYYVRPDGEVVPDSISFDISGAFNNKVTVDLDMADVEPGDDVTVVTTADPDSNVHLLAIDQSVSLLKSGNDVTVTDVHSALMDYDNRYYPTLYFNNDACQVLEESGVGVLTDAAAYRDQCGENEMDEDIYYKNLEQDPEIEEEPQQEQDPEIEEEPQQEQDPEIEEEPQQEQDPEIEEEPQQEQDPEIEEEPQQEQDPEIEEEPQQEEDPEIEEEPQQEQDPEIEEEPQQEEDPERDPEIEEEPQQEHEPEPEPEPEPMPEPEPEPMPEPEPEPEFMSEPKPNKEYLEHENTRSRSTHRIKLLSLSTEDPEFLEPARVRKIFPESWLWTEVYVGSNGSASITATVPDTITSWVVSAFAINSKLGLGVAPTQAHLKVFRPFFVSLNLPYSVTRGEQLALQANVFNYLPDDMQVRVTLAESKRFHNIFIDATGNQELKQVDVVQEVMVKAGEAKSVYFPIVPADLGRIDVEVKAQSTKAADAVRRQLLVEAEGVPKQYNVPVIIDLTEGKTTFSKTIDLTLPANVVKGSELVRISAVGDLMGPTIAKLDSLLEMPIGCGEQRMVLLAPDVYVTDYLKAVNQLTGEIKARAIGYMESGYQGLLNYKHSDGSFSAFGKCVYSGSMWLTAFVARVFHQAKSHIFIDDSVLIQAIQWIIQKQNADGSFPEPGEIIHKNMQGQAGSGVGLTLFVLISLLENRDVLENTNAAGVLAEQARQKALAYAEQEVAKLDDLYVLAMASYAFQLAGSNMTQAVLDKLEAESTQKDGLVHWHQPESPMTSTYTRQSPKTTKAVDIEMTAYVLLTYTKRGDLVAGKSIMQWITKQRNANGGFISTQDTVVALNALSEYAKQTYSNKLKVHITTQLDPETTYSFDIDKTNSLVLQSRENTKVPAQVVITATGSGSALVQAAVSYNVLSEIEVKSFDLKLEMVKETLNSLYMETCTRWLGYGLSSGMAVQEFGIPSGFEADLESITKLDTMKRVETQNKKVILYFDKIGTTPVCLNLRVRRVDFVAKSQPAAVRVYDYYEPQNQETVFYQSQVLKDATICDVCSKCENCRPVNENVKILKKAWEACKDNFISWCIEIAFDIIIDLF